MKKLNKGLNLILPLLPIIALLLIWGLASKIIGNEYILPSIDKTFSALLTIFSNGEFYLALISTLTRSLIAFSISYLLATVLAYLTHKSVNAEKIVAPIISVTRALPTIAVVLLLLFWTNSLVAPVIVTMLVVFPTLYTSSKTAFDNVDKDILDISAVGGANKINTFRYIVFPIVLPDLLISIGSGISLNLKLMVAAEVLSATANSIGYMLSTAKVYFEIAEMISLVVVLVALGIIIEWIFNKISKKVGSWKQN